MIKKIPVTKFSEKIKKHIDEMPNEEIIVLTNHGHPVAYVLSIKGYQEIQSMLKNSEELLKLAKELLEK